jgi:hypothetical protein
MTIISSPDISLIQNTIKEAQNNVLKGKKMAEGRIMYEVITKGTSGFEADVLIFTPSLEIATHQARLANAEV